MVADANMTYMPYMTMFQDLILATCQYQVSVLMLVLGGCTARAGFETLQLLFPRKFGGFISHMWQCSLDM